ncbi:hypothetical protein CNMCM6805_000335 [Aspergillus fumigatiaffinis]|uniref:Uncharacterized protein n=1 Tax=Aspergillus fumigatiaffinis TaxID=340414 RepID=A0A8H4GZ23_9EURO|nr:hypothetical protein CNMCM6805_000335 [Aspergillus fumigatiaffinis]
MHFHLHSYNDLEDIPIKRLVDFDMLRRLKRSQNNKTSSLLPALGRDSDGLNPKPRQFERNLIAGLPPSSEGTPWEKRAVLTYGEFTTLTTPAENFSLPKYRRLPTPVLQIAWLSGSKSSSNISKLFADHELDTQEDHRYHSDLCYCSIEEEWIFERYNAWSAKVPKRCDDPYAFYDLPRKADVFFEEDEWPDRLCRLVGIYNSSKICRLGEKGGHERGRTLPLNNQRYELSIIDAFKRQSGPAFQVPSQYPDVWDDSPISVIHDNCLQNTVPSGVSTRVSYVTRDPIDQGTSSLAGQEIRSRIKRLIPEPTKRTKVQEAGKRTSIVPPKDVVLRVNDDNDDEDKSIGSGTLIPPRGRIPASKWIDMKSRLPGHHMVHPMSTTLKESPTLEMFISEDERAWITVYHWIKPEHHDLFLFHKLRVAENSDEIKAIDNITGNRNKFLLNLLKDVTRKGHILTWRGANTVEEPNPFPQTLYLSQDRDIRRPTFTKSPLTRSRRTDQSSQRLVVKLQTDLTQQRIASQKKKATIEPPATPRSVTNVQVNSRMGDVEKTQLTANGNAI